jgi:nucleoside-diphosphate-sugar epimerase
MTVQALTRNPATAAQLGSLGVATVVADLASDAWHAQLDAGADFVVNTVSSGGGGIAGYRHSYVEGQRSLIKWKQRHPSGRVLYTSSTSVYPQTHGGWVTEADAIAEETESSSSVLLEAEQVLLDAALAGGILRLSGIYGPNRHHLLNQVRSEQRVSGRADVWLNLIHLTDIIQAILLYLKSPQFDTVRILNLSDGHPAMKGEIVAWIASQLSLPVPAFGAPALRRGVAENTPNRRIDASKARAVLNWTPLFEDYKIGYRALLK